MKTPNMLIISLVSIFLLVGSGCSTKRVHVVTGSQESRVVPSEELAAEELTAADQGITNPSSDVGLSEDELQSGSESDTQTQEEATELDDPELGSPSVLGDSHQAKIEEQNPARSVLSELPAVMPEERQSHTVDDGQSIASQPSQERERSEVISSTETQANVLPLERIPERIDIAKADTSEAIQKQVEEMRREELSTALAGFQDVYFEFDSWTIRDEGKQALEVDADLLRQSPEVAIRIEGHTDARGTRAYNMVLGKKRASAVHDYLVELGIDPTRLVIASYGKDRPFCSEHIEECYQQNRRGHLVLRDE